MFPKRWWFDCHVGYLVTITFIRYVGSSLLSTRKLVPVKRNEVDAEDRLTALMVGINKGVRTRILNINPRAFFTPCGCHSWNLLLIGAANSSATANTFVVFVNKIYVLFSKSSKRWDIVKIKLKLTLKPLSETQWESRIGAVKAIFLQFDDVIECVNELKHKSHDSETLSDSDAVLNEMISFEFIVEINVWYEVLLHVNNISKLWQSVQVNLKVAIDTLRSFCSWIQEFCNKGFDNSVAQAGLFVEKSTFEIESQFKEKRTAGKKRMFGYEHIFFIENNYKSPCTTKYHSGLTEKYNGSVDMRLLPLRSKRILCGSDVPSLAASFPVGAIALSFPFETICWGMDAMGACNSAFYFTIGHPENELTTAKENPKCCKQTYKTKIENSEKKK
ncbi:zinc finger MYM-type protein 1 [Trichonephila clavipes]|nr:zinc finger MYM-type protein 1 [Trichonephila clavipes]